VSKKIVTETEIESLAKNGVVEVVRGMIVTPLAREQASRLGLRLVYAGGSVPSAEDLPRDPATGRKGAESEEALRRAVTDEVVKMMAEMSVSAGRVIPAHSPLADTTTATRLAEAKAGEPQRAVVVATGRNHPGIASALTNAISGCGVDIQDLSQTIVSDFFSMIFVLNLDSLSGGLTFKGFKEKLEQAGKAVGAEVVVIHEAILQAMHRP